MAGHISATVPVPLCAPGCRQEMGLQTGSELQLESKAAFCSDALHCAVTSLQQAQFYVFITPFHRCFNIK